MIELAETPGQTAPEPASFMSSWRARLSGYNAVGEDNAPLPWQEGGKKKRTILIVACAVGAAFVGLGVLFILFRPGLPSKEEAIPGYTRGPYSHYRLGSHWRGWGGINHMVVFGDSWSATGSRPSTTPPTSANLIGEDPLYPGNTNTNGPAWTTYLGKDYNKSEMSIANFAIGGATIYHAEDDNDYRTLKKQITEYYPQARAKTASDRVIYDWTADQTLVFLWSGVNDIHDDALDKNNTKPWYFDRTRKLLSELLDQIYGTGARNFFVLNAPPMGRAPVATFHHEEKEWSVSTKEWNTNLPSVVTNFTNTYQDVTMFYFDIETLLNRVMDDPCKVDDFCGIMVTDRMCGGYMLDLTHAGWNRFDPGCGYAADKYLWLNLMHLTTTTHNMLAHAFWRALTAPDKKD